MRHAFLRFVLGLLIFWVPGNAGDWPAIQPEVWAIKGGAESGGKGALILDERVRYDSTETEVRMRVRIFAEEGKAAAGIPAFSHFEEVEGRTVLPSGEITPFNHSKDLVKKSAQLGRWDFKLESLIPPGLTSNCVVDLHYRVPTIFRWNWVEIPILHAYPVRRKVMEMGLTRLDSALLGLKNLKREIKESRDYREYTFTDLPAEEVEPYSLPTLGEHPRFVFFNQPSALDAVSSKEPESYWKEVGLNFYKPVYTKFLSFGRTYKEWSKSLRVGLEGDPVAKAVAILARLEDQIKNQSLLTRAESSLLTKKDLDDRVSPQDLDLSVKRKRTNGAGMHYLFYQLLIDEGLEPKLSLVANRNNRFFRYQLPNLYQFNDILIGVTSKTGALVWFEPSSRYFPPGLVRPEYQGTQALLVDPKDWSCKPFTMGPQGVGANQSLYEYELNLEGEESFKMRARFFGYPEVQERALYLSLEPKEQERKLTEALESELKTFIISKANVENATDGRKNLLWSIEGRREAEDGRRRVFSPFPGLSYPLTIPEAWPETRTSTIVIPYCRQFGASSKFKIPKGWNLGKDPDLTQSNEFGNVRWFVKESGVGDDRQVVVTCFIEINRMYSPASSYTAFREFMGWIESAVRRTLALERQS